MKLLQDFILAAVIGASPLAAAHDNAYLDALKTPNGGQLRMAGPYHVELVVAKDSRAAKTNAVLIYITDHAGNKVSTAGASGKATILAGKQKASIALQPDGDNRLKGAGKYIADPAMNVTVTVELPGKRAEQAQFTPLARTAAARGNE